MKKILSSGFVILLISLLSCQQSAESEKEYINGAEKSHVYVENQAKEVARIEEVLANNNPILKLSSTIVSNEEYEDNIKVQVIQHQVIDQKEYDNESLQDLLYANFYRLSTTSTSSGQTPNSIAIFLYKSKKDYEKGTGQWIAKISKSKNETSPKVVFD